MQRLHTVDQMHKKYVLPDFFLFFFKAEVFSVIFSLYQMKGLVGIVHKVRSVLSEVHPIAVGELSDFVAENGRGDVFVRITADFDDFKGKKLKFDQHIWFEVKFPRSLGDELVILKQNVGQYFSQVFFFEKLKGGK
jgi:hypothetical protein